MNEIRQQLIGKNKFTTGLDDTFTLESINNSMQLDLPPERGQTFKPKYKMFFTALSKKSLEDDEGRLQELSYGDKIIGFKIESSCSEAEGPTNKKKGPRMSQQMQSSYNNHDQRTFYKVIQPKQTIQEISKNHRKMKRVQSEIEEKNDSRPYRLVHGKKNMKYTLQQAQLNQQEKSEQRRQQLESINGSFNKLSETNEHKGINVPDTFVSRLQFQKLSNRFNSSSVEIENDKFIPKSAKQPKILSDSRDFINQEFDEKEELDAELEGNIEPRDNIKDF